MTIVLRLTMAALVATLAMPAAALVYTGTRTVGVNTATISITTDGSFGVLTEANITDFFVTLTSPSRTTSVAYADQAPQLSGGGLSASDRHLTFDFASDGFFAMLFFGRGAYCLDGAASAVTCLGQAPSETVLFFGPGGNVTAPRTGTAIIASTAPEPASWALLITGFGLVGAAMRRSGLLQPR
ncbi:PEPxxWA-CTERM sorting domain-containing protein [Glacieibacterium frigidum]|uniref:PEP-CTERM protein-sorting domain-containing protein n=1 Tax=Glacieibacterium frigidum TaxID=2593303 RepID=A0A552UG01_9SPHN|nr:PEPxxWA-CTERM sorting domain-containing protein [Glacieibacterium frigidum]TRW17119.1 hypothetical protein FMM06_02650 [Glacieibacterium frigidum]